MVGPHPVRPSARPAVSQPGNPEHLQDGLESRGVAPLPGGDQYRQRLLPLYDGEVNPGAQSAPGTSEAVVVRLDGEAAGRLLLRGPFVDAPAACWWARQTVESTFTSQVIKPRVSASACSRMTMRAQVPSRYRRRNRSYTRAQGP